VEVEDLTKHKTDSEQVIIDREACDIVNQGEGRQEARVLRGHHHHARHREQREHGEPHEALQRVDEQVHLPALRLQHRRQHDHQLPHAREHLLMQVAAFGGYDHVWNAYKVAIKEKYRFFSYGDAMLII
jgi:S-adenosylmethionine:tRNA ribosyltransferase-isomerase